MGDYDSHISVDPIAEARDGYYTVKELEIEHSPLKKIETPFKVVNANKIRINTGKYVHKNLENPIFENWKALNGLKSFNKLHDILNEGKGDQIRDLDRFFGLNKTIWNDSHTILSLVFQKNPFQQNQFKKGSSNPITWESYEFLLDYIHSASSAFVLAPDIKFDSSFNFNDYISYVDETISILSDFNNKPVFAPVPIYLNQKNTLELIKNYKYKGYTNLWVNFNASQISGTQIARVRYLLRNIKKNFNIENNVLYFSHMRKEVNRHVLNTKTTASNAMAPFFGSDFIGVSREPARGFGIKKEDELNYIAKNKFKDKKELEKARLLNRTRIFDPNTYYYYNIDKYPQKLPFNSINLQKNDVNNVINSLLLSNEIDKTRNFVEDKKNIKEYVKQKDAIKKDKDLLEGILTGSKNQSKISEFFGNLNI